MGGKKETAENNPNPEGGAYIKHKKRRTGRYADRTGVEKSSHWVVKGKRLKDKD